MGVDFKDLLLMVVEFRKAVAALETARYDYRVARDELVQFSKNRVVELDRRGFQKCSNPGARRELVQTFLDTREVYRQAKRVHDKAMDRMATEAVWLDSDILTEALEASQASN